MARLGGGTSEASTIVTGAVSLVISCKPYATSQAIREAIINNAEHYTHLEDMVLTGNLLNIKESVRNFCFTKKSKHIT